MTDFIIIAGPCLIESRDLTLRVAEHLMVGVHKLKREFPIQFYFKASFDKANRSSINSNRGFGLQAGMRILEDVARNFGAEITTDVHEPYQPPLVRDVVNVIQIPAFLCRQTDMLVAAAKTGRIVNVKKGQFLAPWDMAHVAAKLRDSDCKEFWFTERGSSFGYNRLVNDMTSIPTMQQWAPVIFDATHSVQEPGGLGARSGGRREMIETLARAGIAAGADGIFLETHPDPDRALSDGPNMVPLGDMEALLTRLMMLRSVVSHL